MKAIEGLQFKIVKGMFTTPEHIIEVQAEQAEFGWILVEVFDKERIRFQRPVAESLKDRERFGNPYETRSAVGGMTQEMRGMWIVVVSMVSILFLLAFIAFVVG